MRDDSGGGPTSFETVRLIRKEMQYFWGLKQRAWNQARSMKWREDDRQERSGVWMGQMGERRRRLGQFSDFSFGWLGEFWRLLLRAWDKREKPAGRKITFCFSEAEFKVPEMSG